MNPALLITASGLPALLDVAAPHLEWGPLAPVFVLMAGACVAVLVEAFVPRSGRRPTQIIVTVATLVVAIASTLILQVFPSTGYKQKSEQIVKY